MGTGCDVYEDAPTLIIERDTFANFFHNSEDFFNTFLALAILRWPMRDLQILLTDIYPKGERGPCCGLRPQKVVGGCKQIIVPRMFPWSRFSGFLLSAHACSSW